MRRVRPEARVGAKHDGPLPRRPRRSGAHAVPVQVRRGGYDASGGAARAARDVPKHPHNALAGGSRRERDEPRGLEQGGDGTEEDMGQAVGHVRAGGKQRRVAHIVVREPVGAKHFSRQENTKGRIPSQSCLSIQRPDQETHQFDEVFPTLQPPESTTTFRPTRE